MKIQTTWQRTSATVVALAAWTALVLQLVLILRAKSPGLGVGLTLLEFFSYFTILSNLLVATTTTLATIGSKPSFFARSDVRAAVALYIAVTGSIYLLVLSGLWAPQGLQWLADVLLHYAVPVLYLLWWVFGNAHGRLVWSDALRWLLFPLVYLVWIFVRGNWLHVYPYPFIDLDTLGLAAVLRNGVLVCALFVILGSVLVGIDRLLGRVSR